MALPDGLTVSGGKQEIKLDVNLGVSEPLHRNCKKNGNAAEEQSEGSR